ncbi:hypothetical protein [Polaromonas sp. CG9_12]|nr:hypothetical protein [Polaromonas sp. CG9_12]
MAKAGPTQTIFELRRPRARLNLPTIQAAGCAKFVLTPLPPQKPSRWK